MVNAAQIQGKGPSSVASLSLISGGGASMHSMGRTPPKDSSNMLSALNAEGSRHGSAVKSLGGISPSSGDINKQGSMS